ncbi:AMP-binding protein [Geminicoccaceae bacterium 1502E]|nr:AMP-binding protein [Geminicoccaceae bacterium 1502E]
MNVAHFFARAARLHPNEPALALGGTTLAGWAELVLRASRLAGGLRGRLGLAEGDRVAIFMENRPDYVEAMLAAWWAGLAPVPVNARLHPAEFAWILEDSGAALCVSSPASSAAVAEAAAGMPALRHVLEAGSAEWRRLLEAEPLALAEAGPDAMAWLFYTSGTTGRPKGAMITHRNLRAMTCGYLIDVDPVEPGSALLHAAPLSHGSGLYMVPHAAMGSAQVIPESGGFDAGEVFSMIAAHPRAHMFAAPTMIKRLTRHAMLEAPDLANLATLVYGGAPMYLADLEAAHDVFGFRLAQLYGQGESPMCITALDKRGHEEAVRAGRSDRLQSAGTAQLVVELRIGDEEGRALPPGQAGEIMVRGDSVVPGYWRNAEATSRTMGGGWLRTGDMGVLDEAGFLTLKDRSKDLIISGGSNIYPREVEEVLLCHPKVREVSVVGLPDLEWGERVVACVVAEAGTSEEELDALCRARIARFKRPRTYVFLETLPKSNYGKILKRELRELLASTAG